MRWRTVKSFSPALASCVVLALALACRVGAAAAAEDSRRTDAGDDLVVAALGNWRTSSRLAWQGLELAAEEIGQAGGILGKPLRLWRHELPDDPRQGVRLAQSIADNPGTAMAVLSSRQDVAVPMATVLAYYGVMTMLTKVSVPFDEINLPLVFRMCPTDRDEMDYLVRFCASKGLKRVALFVFNAESARTYANTFETQARARGMEIADRIACDMLTSEEAFGRELLSLQKNNRFDAIFFSGPPALAEKLVQAAAAQGVTQPFLGGSSWDTPELANLADPSRISVYLVTPFAPDPADRPDQIDGKTRRFVAAYRQAYGEDPDAQAAIAYNALHLYAQAVRLTGASAPDKVAQTLAKKDQWDGPFGTVRFNDLGEVVPTTLYIKHFAGGTFQRIDFAPQGGQP